MIVKQELIDRIKDYFNLNTYETKVWLALLGKGIASAGEIAVVSKIPRSRAYDVLESLEKKGFSIVKLGKPVKYMGIKPEVILERLKGEVINDAKEKMNYLSKIKDTEEFMKLEELYKEGLNPVKREDICLSLKGKENISSFLKEMMRNSKEEVIISMDANDANSKKKLLQKTFIFLNRQGVKIKIALFGDGKLITHLNRIFKIKINKIDINLKFFIIDREKVLLYLSDSYNEEAIWLNSEFFAQAFASLFEKALQSKK